MLVLISDCGVLNVALSYTGGGRLEVRVTGVRTVHVCRKSLVIKRLLLRSCLLCLPSDWRTLQTTRLVLGSPSNPSISKPQLVQNSTACIFHRSPSFNHILLQLLWLLAKFWSFTRSYSSSSRPSTFCSRSFSDLLRFNTNLQCQVVSIHHIVFPACLITRGLSFSLTL